MYFIVQLDEDLVVRLPAADFRIPSGVNNDANGEAGEEIIASKICNKVGASISCL